MGYLSPILSILVLVVAIVTCVVMKRQRKEIKNLIDLNESINKTNETLCNRIIKQRLEIAELKSNQQLHPVGSLKDA